MRRGIIIGMVFEWIFSITACRRSHSPDEFAVWERQGRRAIAPEGKTVIFGHTPTFRYHRTLPMRIRHGNRLIGIDFGCAYEDGRLACLRLEDGKEFYSE